MKIIMIIRGSEGGKQSKAFGPEVNGIKDAIIQNRVTNWIYQDTPNEKELQLNQQLQFFVLQVCFEFNQLLSLSNSNKNKQSPQMWC